MRAVQLLCVCQVCAPHTFRSPHMPEQYLAKDQREREKAGKAIKLKLDGKMDTVPNICFSSIKQSENKHMGDESSYQRIRAQWVC